MTHTCICKPIGISLQYLHESQCEHNFFLFNKKITCAVATQTVKFFTAAKHSALEFHSSILTTSNMEDFSLVLK